MNERRESQRRKGEEEYDFLHDHGGEIYSFDKGATWTRGKRVLRYRRILTVTPAEKQFEYYVNGHPSGRHKVSSEKALTDREVINAFSPPSDKRD